MSNHEDDGNDLDPGQNPLSADSPAIEENSEAKDVVQVEVHAEYDKLVNFALQQNDVPIIKRLVVANGPKPLSAVTLTIKLDNELIEPLTIQLDEIRPNEEISLDQIQLTLSATTLATQKERESTNLVCRLEAFDYAPSSHVFPIEVLAVNEWPGMTVLPEILAAFVLPNSKTVNTLLAKALRVHEERNLAPSFGGYQSKNPADALEQVRSIYETLVAEDLGYVGAPASFEENGQKVRFPDEIIEHRMGNCLDLTLMAAGLIEQSGLHPVIVILKDHAFLGVWTMNQNFPEPTVDDLASIRKRIDVDDIVVFETTAITRRPLVPFHQARSEARLKLNEPDDFIATIDIAAARKLQIRPVVQKDEGRSNQAESKDPIEAQLSEDELQALKESGGETTAKIPIFAEDLKAERPRSENPESRVQSWQRRLLDLSLRNRLLNFKETKRTASLLIPDCGEFERALDQAVRFTIRGRPKFDGKQSTRDLEAMGERTHDPEFRKHLSDDLSNHIVHADLAQKDVDDRLLALYREAKSQLEETGSNTLFLATGFLVWFETEESVVERRAPLVLIPVSLTRKSAKDGFRLTTSDDEIRVNTTLLEKLKQDYDIDTASLENIPNTEYGGIDLDSVFKEFRKTIMNIPRWDVVEASALGLFSFAKFLMWQDLEAHEERILENPVVKHLVETPGQAFQNASEFPNPRELDQTFPAAESFCPLDADSSQLRAIKAAAMGQTFVLQGPPGTGKSQTITNLISQCLGMGKRVLFVAEKMAALNVVHDRLSRLGLASSCLELHSKKTSKRHVLAQLQEAIESRETSMPENWQAGAEQLTNRRDELNAYVTEIHERHPPGLSIYQAASRLTAKKGTVSVDFKPKNISETSRSQIEHLEDLVSSLATAAEDLTPINNHGLAAFEVDDWSPALNDEVQEAIGNVQEQSIALRTQRLALQEFLALPGNDRSDSLSQLKGLEETANLLLNAVGTTTQLLEEPAWQTIEEILTETIERGRAYKKERDELESLYRQEIFSTDLISTIGSLQAARASFPPLSWIRVFLARRSLKTYFRSELPDTDTLVLDLSRLLSVNERKAFLDQHADHAKDLFGRFWRGAESDWDKLSNILAWTGKLRSTVWGLTQKKEWRESNFQDRVVQLAVNDRDRLGPGTDEHKLLLAFSDHVRSLRRAMESYANTVRLAVNCAFETKEDEGYLPAVERELKTQEESLGDLKSWCHWRRLVQAAEAEGLSHFVQGLLTGEIETDQAKAVFEKSFLEQWLANRLKNSQLLRRFNSRDHERKIEAFAKLDREHLSLSGRYIKAKTSQGLPTFSREAAATSEVGILQRQLKLKRRHMPIRQLFQKLPNLLPTLKPCLLMSPLSVAQYLSSEYEPADIVVFDEASQIPVWDAIGALARGKSAVVVGDSKQLPPTMFFRTQGDDDFEGDGELIEEVESILDECEAGGLPSINLEWHYRSRHEDLIAFSNHHYYRSRLMTFPSSGRLDEKTGITLVTVENGIYDRSKTRTNDVEAQALVREIVHRLKQRANGENEKSIGVVAFSRAQQTKIEDLIDEARRQEPSIEPFFDESSDEPVFVKNLENVQGDERDVILFSICYGPTEDGRVSMNFGPLNREGGERRLNVAITRARRELMVFSSLDHQKIDLSRSRATGVAHLRSFLEYAQRGPSALPMRMSSRALHAAETPFITQLAAELAARGHQVETHIGSSAYPIGIGVRSEENLEAFRLGLESDGSNYQAAATARDRDRTRPTVLKNLGWNMQRVWVSDWLENPQKEMERIEQALNQQSQKRSEDQAETAEETAEEIEPSDNEETSPEEKDGESLEFKLVDRVEIYRATILEPFDHTASSLYDEQLEKVLQQEIQLILSHEAPISLNLLTRRMMNQLAIDRLTAKVKKRIEELVMTLPEEDRPRVFDSVFFLKDTSPENYRTFRTAALGEIPRQAEDIHPIEIANAARRVLKEQFALPLADLPKETARMLGFPRLGSKVKTAMTKGIEEMLSQGWGIVDNNSVRLVRTDPK